jgi:hypothetical protein
VCSKVNNIANTIELLCLLCLVGNAFCTHKGLNRTDKRVVYAYVIRGNLAKSSAKVVVLNSLDKQRRKIGSSLTLFAINFNKVEKQLNKLSILVNKLDVYSLEMFIAIYCLLCISANIEAANCIVVEIPNNLLLLSAEVPNDARH